MNCIAIEEIDGLFDLVPSTFLQLSDRLNKTFTVGCILLYFLETLRILSKIGFDSVLGFNEG